MQQSSKPQDSVRFPIALKLILATVTLVAAIAVGFVITGLMSTQKQFTHAAERLARSEIESLKIRGLATARNLADGTASPLLEDDPSRVSDTIVQVTEGDDEMRQAWVVLPGNRLVAAAGNPDLKLGSPVPNDVFQRLSQVEQAAELQDDFDISTGQESIAFGARISVAGRTLGYLYLEMSTRRVLRALEEIESERHAALNQAILRTFGVGAVAVMIGIILAIFQGLRFSQAIRNLTRVATEVGRGNLEARAERSTNDEIGLLCDRFNEMTGQVKTLLKESAEKAALDQELERANAIQTLMLPPRKLLENSGMAYLGYCQPASQMGGDWWHHYPLDEDRVMLLVGDVTGHGISSAMLTASTKACCDTLLLEKDSLELSRFMSSLDHVIRESGKGELVMTMFVAIFDRRARKVIYANAGHNFPFLFRGGKPKSLVAQGGRLGDGTTYNTAEHDLEEGDLFVFYTDGIIEGENPQGKAYGVRRFRKLLTELQTSELNTMQDTLLKDAFTFFDGNPPDDDITLVLCRAS